LGVARSPRESDLEPRSLQESTRSWNAESRGGDPAQWPSGPRILMVSKAAQRAQKRAEHRARDTTRKKKKKKGADANKRRFEGWFGIDESISKSQIKILGKRLTPEGKKANAMNELAD